MDWLWAGIKNSGKMKFIPPLAAASAVACLAFTTFERNHVWRSRLSLWEDAVAKAPGKARTWGNLGVIHAEEGRLDEAIRAIETARSLNPQFLNAHRNLANLYLLKNEPRNALFACVEAEKANPMFGRDVELLCSTAISFLALGDLEKAERVFNSLLNEFPRHQRVRIGLACLCKARLNHDQAVHHLKAAASIAPLPPAAADLLAEYHPQAGIAAQ